MPWSFADMIFLRGLGYILPQKIRNFFRFLTMTFRDMNCYPVTDRRTESDAYEPNMHKKIQNQQFENLAAECIDNAPFINCMRCQVNPIRFRHQNLAYASRGLSLWSCMTFEAGTVRTDITSPFQMENGQNYWFSWNV